MRQSRWASFVEAKTNAVVGLVVSWCFTYYVLPAFGFWPTASEAAAITACYFVLSMGRSYVIRRIFNNIRWG